MSNNNYRNGGFEFERKQMSTTEEGLEGGNGRGGMM